MEKEIGLKRPSRGRRAVMVWGREAGGAEKKGQGKETRQAWERGRLARARLPAKRGLLRAAKTNRGHHGCTIGAEGL